MTVGETSQYLGLMVYVDCPTLPPCDTQSPPMLWDGIPSPNGEFPIPVDGGVPPCDTNGDGFSNPLDVKWFLGRTFGCAGSAGPTPPQLLNAAAWFLDNATDNPPCNGFTGCGDLPPMLYDSLPIPITTAEAGALFDLGGCGGGNPAPPNIPSPLPSIPGPIQPPDGPPPYWDCAAGAGVAPMSTPEPVSLAYGHKLEMATDLVVTVPGRDFKIVRSYSSQPDFDGSKLLGFNWQLNALQFLEENPDGSVRICSAAGGGVTFVEDAGHVWRAAAPITQTITKLTSPAVWRLTEPGAYEIDFKRYSTTDTGLNGLIDEQRDVYGNKAHYVYQNYVSGNPAYITSARLSAIFLNGTDDTNSDAKIQFGWNLASGPNHGKLANIKVIRWDSNHSNPQITQKVSYTYKADGDGNAAAVGSEGDLIQVVVSERVDNSTSGGEPWRTTVTQYRYHTASIADEDGTDNDHDGFFYEFGSNHQLKAVILPEQIEYAVQKRFRYSATLHDVAAEARQFLTLPDEAVAFAESDHAYKVIDLAAKVIERYQHWSAQSTAPELAGKVWTQYIQSSCGCGSATQGRKLQYFYLPSYDDSSLYARTTKVDESRYVDGAWSLYRSHFYDLQDFGSGDDVQYLTVNVVFEDREVSEAPKWVTHYDYDSARHLIRECTPSAKDIYTEAISSQSPPAYSAKSSDGLVYAYGYNSDHRRTETRVRKGDSTDLSSFTLLSRTTYGGGGKAHLPVQIERFSVGVTGANPSGNASEVEKTIFTYGFHSGDAIAWIEADTEAEATDENGPGGSYYSHEFFDTKGLNTWSRAADESLTRREFDAMTGVVKLAERNADGPPSFSSMPSHGSFDGREADGHSLTTEATIDKLGRITSITDPRGIVSRIARQIRALPARPGIGYYAVVTLPHAFTESSNTRFDGPATVIWMNAGDSIIAATDSSVVAPTEGSPSDFGAIFSGYEYSLGAALSKSTVQHDLSGLPTSHKDWHSLAGIGDGGGFYTTTFTYDELGRQKDVIDPVGTITRTSYDRNDRVTSVAAGTTEQNLKTIADYFYDGGEDPESGVGNGNLTYVRLHVDDQSVRDYVLKYDDRDRLERILPPAPPVALVAYDNLGRVIKEAVFSENPTNIDATTNRGSFVRTFYSQRGLAYRRQIAINPANLSQGYLEADSWFDGAGRTVATWAPNSPGVKMTFNGLGQPVASYATDRGGDTSYSDVFSASQHAAVLANDIILQETNYRYVSAAGAQRGLIDLITTHRRAHDAGTSAGSLQSLASSKSVASYLGAYYDGASRLIRAVDFGTNDSNNLFASGSAPTITQSSPPTAGPSASTLITELAYDIRGLVDHVTDPMGRKTKLFYDDLSRRIAVVENHQEAGIEWDSEANAWIATGLDTSAATQDFDRVTSYVYDGADHIRKQIAHLPTTTNNAQITEYIYNAISGGYDADSRIDSHNLLSEVRFPNETTGLPGTTDEYIVRYAYDRQGDLRYRKDQNGTTHIYTRDELGRVTRDQAGFASGTNIDQTIAAITAEFDVFGRRDTIKSRLANEVVRDAVQMTYNSLWQLAEFRQQPAGDLSSGWLAVGYQYSTLAANFGSTNASNYTRPSALVYPNSDSVNYIYGGTNTLNDRLSRLETISSGNDGVMYQYLGLNTPVTVEYPTPYVLLDRTRNHNGTHASGTYPGLDKFGRVIRHMWVDGGYGPHAVSSAVPNIPSIVEITSTYNNASDKLTNYDGRPYGSSVAANRPNRDFQYEYDNLNRLKEAKRGVLVPGTGTGTGWTPSPSPGSGGIYSYKASQRWRLDILGNHLSADSDLNADGAYSAAGEQMAGEFNLANEIDHLTVNSSPNVTLPFAYDKAGNLEEKATGSGGDARFVYVHDAWNRLVKVQYKSSPNSTAVDRSLFQYNGLHQRVIKLGDESDISDGILDQKRVMYYSAPGMGWQLLQERIDDNYPPSSPGSSTIDRDMVYVWGIRGVDDIAIRKENRNFSNDNPQAEPPVTYDRVFYHLTDVGGSTVAILDNTGKLLERISYSAYGEARHHPRADLNGDGATTSTELNRIRSLGLSGGTAITSANYEVDCDLDRDGKILGSDYTLANAIGVETALAPGKISRNPQTVGFNSTATDNIVGYCGYIYNFESSIYTVRFRHYDPGVGRWLERDPLGYVGGSNLYQNVHSNPLRFVDPFGLIDDPLIDPPDRPIHRDYWTPEYYNKLTATQLANQRRLVEEGKMTPEQVAQTERELNAFTRAVSIADTDAVQAEVDAMAAAVSLIPVVGLPLALVIEGGQIAVDVKQGQYSNAAWRAGGLGFGVGLQKLAKSAGAYLKKLAAARAAAKAAAVEGEEAGTAAAKLKQLTPEEAPAKPKCGDEGGGPCFPPGTLILMADGSTKRIEEIKQGDEVLADDPDDDKPAVGHPVTFVSENFTVRLIHVEIDADGDGVSDGEFAATGHHPIWTTNRGWQWAVALTTGDTLHSDGGWGESRFALTVVRIWEEQIVSLTYNLSVEGVHTFFVVASDGTSVLVHNDDDAGSYRSTGGHHIHAQSEFIGDPVYDPNAAISISQADMRVHGWDHDAMTQTQRRLFRELAESGRPLTMEESNRIAKEALMAGGVPEEEAERLVRQSANQLAERGITSPARIPWSCP